MRASVLAAFFGSVVLILPAQAQEEQTFQFNFNPAPVFEHRGRCVHPVAERLHSVLHRRGQ